MGTPSTVEEFRRELAGILEREADPPSLVRIETDLLETHVRRATELFPSKTALSPAD